MKNVNIFHVALTLSIFVGGILLAGWGISSCWGWLCRETFTSQNDVTIDDRVREAVADPTWFTRGVRVIAPVVERREEPKRSPRPVTRRQRQYR